MSSLLTKVHAIKDKVDLTRQAAMEDTWVLHGSLEAIKQIAPDQTTRSVAEAGRFYAEWMASEFESNLDELLELLEALAQDMEGRSE